MRRFIKINEIFAKRFATNLNKYFNYYIDEKIIKLIKYFNSYINYQNLHFAKIAIIKKIAIIYEIDIN